MFQSGIATQERVIELLDAPEQRPDAPSPGDGPERACSRAEETAERLADGVAGDVAEGATDLSAELRAFLAEERSANLGADGRAVRHLPEHGTDPVEGLGGLGRYLPALRNEVADTQFVVVEGL